MELPTLKLTYFGIAGAAEKIRLAFHLGGIPFEDERITFPEWAELKEKAPFGQLPILSINGGEPISQSEAMLRYAGRLAPEIYPDELAIEIDEMIGLVGDFNRAWTPCLYMGMKPEDYGYEKDFKGTDAHSALVQSMREKFLKEQMPKWMNFFVRQLRKPPTHTKLRDGRHYMCGDTPTIADCMLIPELRKFGMGFIDHVPVDTLKAYPLLCEYIERFLALPPVSTYYTKTAKVEGNGVSCACGAVKVKVDQEAPLFAAYCHCVECRLTTSSPYFWGAGYSSDKVTIMNEQNCNSFTLKVAERLTCKSCGTYVIGKAGAMSILPCALLKTPPAAQFHIYCSEKSAPALPADGLPRFSAGPGSDAWTAS